MSNYASLNELFITVDNATHVINNVAHDDDTVTVATGIDWFTFQNVVVSNIYVSGNSWVGIGTNAEASSIKVNRRDTKLYDLWTEIGTIGDSIQYKFYRWRWSGYAQYNSTSTGDKLIWDCVLFEDGTVYLNIDTWVLLRRLLNTIRFSLVTPYLELQHPMVQLGRSYRASMELKTRI